MADNREAPAATPATDEAPPAPAVEEPKIMCYVSKRMVPKSQTVEVEYQPGKKVWVLSKYIRYDLDESTAA